MSQDEARPEAIDVSSLPFMTLPFRMNVSSRARPSGASIVADTPAPLASIRRARMRS